MRNTYYFITCDKKYFHKDLNATFTSKKRDAYILSSSNLKKLETILEDTFNNHLGNVFKLKRLSIIDTILYL